MENTSESINILNTLIEINNDRIEGYQTASKETEERDLKNLFSQMMQTSQKCKDELVSEVTALGGTVEEGTMTSGKFFRAWMDVKAALTGHNRKAILESCEFGEDAAVKTYDNTIKDSLGKITYEQQQMITAQRALIKADHDQIKKLRDTAVTA